MGGIEGLYIFDEHNNAIFEHVYAGRPPSASILLAAYLSHSAPRPATIYVPNVNPPTLLCSITQDRLLFLCPTSTDVEPLLILEFLHRATDALDEFLGTPLLASKVDSSYDIVTQVVGEICNGGLVSNTEPNALSDVVDAPSWMGNILGGFGLPAASPSLGAPGALSGGTPSFMAGIGSGSMTNASQTSAVPWRKANVRHTSNELYVDIVERLSVILAPSGRPLSAVSQGTIIFTAKISGVPDLLLSLTSPGGKAGIQSAMDLPSFHPCVRLARWREKPGEISFVPPDGKFALAGYECDLLPGIFDSNTDKISTPKLDLPLTLETRGGLGSNGDEFEVRLKPRHSSTTSASSALSSSSAANALGRNLNSTRFGSGSGSLGSSAAPGGGPPIEDIVVTIPISKTVRNVEDLRATRGQAHFLASEGIVEWRIPSKEAAMLSPTGTTLKFALTGHSLDADDVDGAENGFSLDTNSSSHDEDGVSSTNGQHGRPAASRAVSTESRKTLQVQKNVGLMPRSASLSFTMKGWLPSGIKVDGLTVNAKTSRGLGAGVTPYKGVKYHTVSQKGIEVRT